MGWDETYFRHETASVTHSRPGSGVDPQSDSCDLLRLRISVRSVDLSMPQQRSNWQIVKLHHNHCLRSALKPQQTVQHHDFVNCVVPSGPRVGSKGSQSALKHWHLQLGPQASLTPPSPSYSIVGSPAICWKKQQFYSASVATYFVVLNSLTREVFTSSVCFNISCADCCILTCSIEVRWFGSVPRTRHSRKCTQQGKLWFKGGEKVL